MSYFATPMGLGAAWDPYCTGTCEKECMRACTAPGNESNCLKCKNLYSEYRRAAAIGAAAAIIGPKGGSAPAYASPSSGMPSWLLPVGVGLGAIVLVMVLKK